jgi:energy-coupling factor transport system ATP-binding protein
VIARLSDVSFAYPAAGSRALENVSLEIKEGSFVLLAGPSAGGKSTLLRLFNGLIPQFHGGTLSGTMSVAGLDPARTPARRMASIAGMVFQEPEAQAIAETVEDDVAFAMEQQGVPQVEMHRRVAHLLGALQIEHLRHRRLATLSGGERQRVAIASVLALEPGLLLLDEPTSQLDAEGGTSVIAAIEQLNAGGRITVLLAEHRLERLLPIVDEVVEVEGGRVRTMTPRSAAATLRAVPPVCEIGRQFGIDPVPLTVDEGLVAFANRGLGARSEPLRSMEGERIVEINGLTVAYGEHIALRDLSFALREGEILALVGPNGSGKSTLFRAIAGLTEPVSGEVLLRGAREPRRVSERTATVALVPQDPSIALYHETVAEEIRTTLKARRLGDPQSAMANWGIGHLAQQHPRDLSVGQQQRVAIAAMLAHLPRVWLLDEPTRGADAAAKAWLATRLREHAANGGAAIVATHDIESAAAYATRVVGLEHGRMAFDLNARRAFAAGGPLPTQTARLVPGAIAPAEVVAR